MAARRRAKLHLVGQSPTDVFDDLDKLRTEMAAPMRRSRSAETFARIPHDRALELMRHNIGGPAWVVLIELDRLILKARGRNPVRFWSTRLRAAGLTRHTRTRALRQLEAAGVIKIEQRGKGLSPMVTHLWYPQLG
jgi:hypothetical protein